MSGRSRAARLAILVRATIALTTTVLTLVASAPAASAGWWDDLDKGEAVQLEDVFAQPSRHSDRILTFFCVLLGRDEVYFPLATPFSEAKWDNVVVWDDGAPLWEESAWNRRARPYLYIGRSHPARDALLRLEKFTRLEVTARIRAIHRGIPFLEILSWRLSGWRLGGNVVTAVMRGDNKVREGGNDSLSAALDFYTSALRADLAPVYALQVRKRAADVMRRLGRHAEAVAMEGTEIRGASFAPEPTSPATAPTPDGTEGAPPPFVTEDLPGQPADAPGAAPAPTAAPPPVSTDLPGVEATPAPAPSTPRAVPEVSPPAAAPFPFPPPSSPPSLSPPGTAPGVPGVLPPPIVLRPDGGRDLPVAPAPPAAPPSPSPAFPPPASPAPTSPAPSSPAPTSPPPASPPAAPLPPAATPTPPPATPPPVPPAQAESSSTTPPRRQPRLEGVK